MSEGAHRTCSVKTARHGRMRMRKATAVRLELFVGNLIEIVALLAEAATVGHAESSECEPSYMAIGSSPLIPLARSPKPARRASPRSSRWARAFVRFRRSARARRVPHWAMANAAKPADIAGFPWVGHYWGLLAARNWELIQPFKRPFSTWVQSPSRRVTVNRAPFGAVPTAAPVAAGVDLMFTPGRCKKTISWFCCGGTVWGIAVCPAVTPRPAWGDASAVTAGGTSGDSSRRWFRC